MRIRLRLKLTTDIDLLSHLSLIKRVSDALSVVGQAHASDTHALCSDLVISSTSKVSIISVSTITLTHSCEQQIVMLMYGLRLFYRNDALLERCNVFAKATVLDLKWIVFT